MALTAALVVSSLVLWVSSYFTFRKPPGEASAPLLERLWFHSTITWPIVFKGALGAYVSPSGEVANGILFAIWTCVPSLIFGCLILAQRVRAGAIRIYYPGAIFLLVASMSLGFLLTGDGTTQTLISVALFAPFVLGGKTRVPIRTWRNDARISILVTATVFAAVAVVTPELIVGYCRDDKCSLSGYVLTSPVTGNGNFAGLALALVLPWALLGLGSLIRTFAWSVPVLLIVEESGSRSALFVAVVVAGAALFIAAWPRVGGVVTKFVILPMSFIASVATAVIVFPPDTATLRGSLWSRARELMEVNPLWGLGPSYWVRQPHTADFWANYSAHNLWLDIGVSSGLIGVGLVVVALVWMLRCTAPSDIVLISLAFSAVLLLGTLESPLQFGRIGIAPFAALIFVFAGSIAEDASKSSGWLPLGIRPVSRRKIRRH